MPFHARLFYLMQKGKMKQNLITDQIQKKPNSFINCTPTFVKFYPISQSSGSLDPDMVVDALQVGMGISETWDFHA